MDNKIESLFREYNPTHDLFDDEIQMNYIDGKLLDLIVELNNRVMKLEKKVRSLSGEFLNHRHG